jgi:hypothetical protein
VSDIPDDIKIGDRFEWQPYGTKGWPRAYEKIRVTRIIVEGKDVERVHPTLNSSPDSLIWSVNEDKKNSLECWNTLSHFWNMTKRLPS